MKETFFFSSIPIHLIGRCDIKVTQKIDENYVVEIKEVWYNKNLSMKFL